MYIAIRISHTDSKGVLQETLFSLQENLFSLQRYCFHNKDFPVNSCTSLLRIAALFFEPPHLLIFKKKSSLPVFSSTQMKDFPPYLLIKIEEKIQTTLLLET